MASVSRTSEKSDEHDDLQTPLISGLPDDIALLCLARIPRRYHNVLRRVSKRWKALLGSEEWRSCRENNNLQETWIYAVCRRNKRINCYYVFDPNSAKRSWKCLQGVPAQCLKRQGMAFETIGSKLYILGGCSWGEDATAEVYSYNCSLNAWAKASPMPTARCYFVSAALGDQLYVTNGAGMGSESPPSWDTYNSASDTWTSKRQPELVSNIQKSIAFAGKIHTVHEAGHGFHYAGTFDPSSGAWAPSGGELALCWRGPTVVAGGMLYMLDETSGAKLVRRREETGEWQTVGRLSPLLVKPPCQLVAYGRTVVVVGRGLSTVAVDVDRASKVGGGVLVSSYSYPELDSDLSVLCCKAMTI